jgi:hypothetical protein
MGGDLDTSMERGYSASFSSVSRCQLAAEVVAVMEVEAEHRRGTMSVRDRHVHFWWSHFDSYGEDGIGGAVS